MKQTKKVTHLDFVNSAKNYLGCPYFYKGRSRGGLDCSGLLIKALNSTVLPEYNFLDYGNNPNPRHVKKEILTFADEIKKEEFGALILIKLHNLANHIAIFIENEQILHTYGRAGKVIIEKYNTYWKRKVDSIYRVRI